MAELTYRDAVIRGIAQEMTRDPDVVFLGEDVAKAGGVFKATVGLYEQFGPLRVRDTPISEQAIMGAAMGAAMTGLKPIAEIMFSDFFAVCFDYIANEFPEKPLHVERPGQMSAGHPHRQRRGLALRRAAFAERRELVHDDSGPQGRGAVVAARRDRASGGVGARSRSGDLSRTQVALRHQGRSAGRRDRRQARHREHRAAGQGRHHRRAGADGAAGACGRGEAQERARHRLRSDRRALAGAARHADHFGLGRAHAPAVHRGGKSAAVRLGRGDRLDRRRRGVLRSRRPAGAHHHAAYSAAGRRHSGRSRAAERRPHRRAGEDVRWRANALPSSPGL